jgi:arylsulfatase A-like enzyme
MNFQAVSVAQKLSGSGYRDAKGTPSDGLLDAMVHTDASLARLVDALAAARLTDKTLVIITAKHGQSPIDPSLRKILDKKALTKVIADAAPGGVAHTTYDTAAYIWLKDHRDAVPVARALAEHSADLSVFKVYEGVAMAEFFNDAKKDGRMPDVMMQPNEGVIITKASASKIAEHGGAHSSDRNVALLVAGPGVSVGVNDTPVATTSVAPTILESLGIDATVLEAVRIEGTGALPRPKF